MKPFALSLIILSCMAWAEVPQSQHVWMVTEENHSYESVIGNMSMPYFNSLATKYGLAAQYYSEQHNSLSALMWLVAGQPVTYNDQTKSCYNLDNIARHLIARGFKWRSYQEDLPYPAYTGLSYLNYLRRHNPIIDFTDTCTSTQSINSVPFTELAKDIANHSTPNYAYITPNTQHDAHNGTLAAADYWLSQHIPAILALPEFKAGGDGILFIAWDEGGLGSTQDNRCTATITNSCGGRVATLVIGPQVKPHYQSSVRYDHANLLQTICAAMGLGSCPGAGVVANPMADFFDDVAIATPFPNAVVASPVHIQATTSNSVPVTAVQIYVDNVLKYHVSASSVNTQLAMTTGWHHVVVQSWDTAGEIHKRAIYVNVQPEAVVVTNPAPSAVVPPTVGISATGGGQTAVSKMQLYIDGFSKYQTSGSTLNTSVSLTSGIHAVAVEAADSSGALTTNKFSVTSASPAVQILSPAPNATFYAPLVVSAKTVDPTPVSAVQIFVDSKLGYQVSGTGMQALLPIAAGTHSVVVQAMNKSGVTYKKSITVNVVNVPITVSSPATNATVSSPVSIVASAPTGSPVQIMQIYLDGKLAYKASGQSVHTSLAMSAGKHYIQVKGWDGWVDNWSNGEYINVQ
jgi:phosphatidylinositol-3-phosphatase